MTRISRGTTSSNDRSATAKRPGKTEWAGRRRPATRRAGFTVHPDVTGGELEVAAVAGWVLDGDGGACIRFSFPAVPAGTLLGFGGWYLASPGASARLEGFARKATLIEPMAPDWSKFGSVWYADGDPLEFSFCVDGTGAAFEFAVHGIEAGVIEHEFYEAGRATIPPARHKRLMGNMWFFAPEAVFVNQRIHVPISEPQIRGGVRPLEAAAKIHLKSCNRCARFLPINYRDERRHLSFSNHCVAQPPCIHSTFSRLRDLESGKVHVSEYGFQLECRFCKKFTVNTPHNPKRSAAQMKEDAARRRAIEVLLSELYEDSPSLSHRRRFGGQELSDAVWARFDGRCFKCGMRLARQRDMHLDHTRPLALLWPLDETATCLCKTHNGEKRDRPPAEYYSPDELERLAVVTGIPIGELLDPSPNREAIELLAARLDWFFEEFLRREELQTVRDGKRPADLLVRAVQKAIGRLPGFTLDLKGEYRRRST
jgi:hypothetical protein